jgi:hypothetical protein
MGELCCNSPRRETDHHLRYVESYNFNVHVLKKTWTNNGVVI